MQRALIEGLEAYESKICPACNFHEDLHDLDKHDFQIDDPVCPILAEAHYVERVQSERDQKRRGDNPPADRKDPADGRRLTILYKGRVSPS